MTTATGEARTGKTDRAQPVCLKQPPKTRFRDLKPVIIALLVFTLVVPPFLLVPGDKPPTPAPGPPEYRSTSMNEMGIVSREQVADLVQAADGGLVVALTTRFDVTGDSDIMLVKISADGTEKWRKTYGQSSMDEAGALVQTADGGFALAGRTRSRHIWGNFLLWVIKTDAEGNVEWNKTFNLSGSLNEERSVNSIASIVQTGDNGFVLALNVDNHCLLYKIDSNGNVEWSRNYNEDIYVAGFYFRFGFDMVLTADSGFAFASAVVLRDDDSDFYYNLLWLVKTDGNGNVEWNKYYDVREVYALSLVATMDGGYALGLESYYYRSHGMVIIKTDSNGDMEWKKSYGKGRDASIPRDLLVALIQTEDEGYILAGNIYSTITASNDAWLVKTDSNGNMEWSQTYGESSYDGASDILQTAGGGFVLAGTSFFTPWTPSLINHEPFWPFEVSAWLIRTDEDGNEEWKHVFDGREDEEWANDVIQTADGGFAFAGPAGSPSGGGLDAWIAKTDGNGIMTWNRSYGGSEDDIATAIIQTVDGGFAITGYTCSWGAGNSDAWLIKTDGNGTMTWNRSYGGPEDDGAETVIQTADGGFVLAGYARFRGTSNSDAWLVKTDGNGTVMWNQTFGGDKDDKVLDIFQLANGSFILLGYHGQELIEERCSCCVEVSAGTYDDAWVLTVDEHGSLQQEFVYERSENVRFHDIRITGDGITVAGLSNEELVYLRIDNAGISQWERPLPYRVGGDLVFTDSGEVILTGHIVWNGATHLLLYKMDPDGVVQWKSCYKVDPLFGSGFWTAGITNVLIQLDGGGYALAGGVLAHGLAGDSTDAWLARVDGNGTLLWEHAYGTGGVETGPEYYLFQAGTIILESDNDYKALSFNTGAARARGLPLIVLLGLVAVSITRKKENNCYHGETGGSAG